MPSTHVRGRSSMVEPQSSKLATRVRFPSPAPTRRPQLSDMIAELGPSSSVALPEHRAAGSGPWLEGDATAAPYGLLPRRAAHSAPRAVTARRGPDLPFGERARILGRGLGARGAQGGATVAALRGNLPTGTCQRAVVRTAAKTLFAPGPRNRTSRGRPGWRSWRRSPGSSSMGFGRSAQVVAGDGGGDGEQDGGALRPGRPFGNVLPVGGVLPAVPGSRAGAARER